ncbi:MAG: CoA-binding protein [Bacteroidales bacterium]|nr:CoA-binding protein [Bacteroidales bacterium]
MAELKKTVVIGASPNPSRFSFKAVQLLTAHGHPVEAIGRHTGSIDNIMIRTEKPVIEGVDTVTMYLAPANQPAMYDYILHVLKPKRIIFNPGTENDRLARMAENDGIKVVEDCTLILLSRGLY